MYSKDRGGYVSLLPAYYTYPFLIHDFPADYHRTLGIACVTHQNVTSVYLL